MSIGFVTAGSGSAQYFSGLLSRFDMRASARNREFKYSGKAFKSNPERTRVGTQEEVSGGGHREKRKPLLDMGTKRGSGVAPKPKKVIVSDVSSASDRNPFGSIDSLTREQREALIDDKREKFQRPDPKPWDPSLGAVSKRESPKNLRNTDVFGFGTQSAYATRALWGDPIERRSGNIEFNPAIRMKPMPSFDLVTVINRLGVKPLELLAFFSQRGVKKSEFSIILEELKLDFRVEKQVRIRLGIDSKPQQPHLQVCTRPTSSTGDFLALGDLQSAQRNPNVSYVPRSEEGRKRLAVKKAIEAYSHG